MDRCQSRTASSPCTSFGGLAFTLLRAFRNNHVLNPGVAVPRQNSLLDQLILSRVGSSLNNPIRVSVADSGQRLQLIAARRVDIERISLSGGPGRGAGLRRSKRCCRRQGQRENKSRSQKPTYKIHGERLQGVRGSTMQLDYRSSGASSRPFLRLGQVFSKGATEDRRDPVSRSLPPPEGKS